ncbi:hypothetical protein ACEU2D_23550 [Brevibacillus laterosporus]|uniref:hypothetical protein n=1 Tax=Brevibacillus laterosporus TaxID=1465 RepID=UPI0035A7389B
MGKYFTLSDLVVDTRFNSLVEQEQQCTEILKRNTFDIKGIENVNYKDNNTFLAKICFSLIDNEEVHSLTLSVMKVDNQWKLLITGEEIRSKDYIYNIESRLNTIESSTLPTSIAYYEFYFGKVALGMQNS